MGDLSLLINCPWPWWLLVLAAGGGAGVLTWRGYRRRRTEISPARLSALKWLRLGGWALLFFCLLQPIYRQYHREPRASRVTVLVDDSESMSFADRPNGPSRLERVRELLGAEKKPGLLAQLERSFQVKLEAFGPGARPVEKTEELKALGERTDLAKSLNDAFTRLRGPDAAGLILISDGADTARGDVARSGAAFRRAGIRIYALGVGAPDVPDLAISQVRCRRTVSKDTLLHVEVDVARSGLAPGKFPVRILRQGQTVKEAAVDLTGEKATAAFEFLPADQGFLEYEARIDPAPGELVLTNNSLAFGVMAFSRTLRVLYMEGSVHQHEYYGRYVWGQKWEHEFMKEALEEDRDVDVDVLLWPGEGGALPPGFKTPKEGYPRSKKELYQYDVIIDSDIPYEHFTPDQVKWTVDFAAKHGGGFVMVGGWHAFGEGGYAKTAYDRMLPVEMNPNDKHADGVDFRWRVTDEGRKHPIMQVAKDPGRNREAWEKLNTLGPNSGPGFHGYSKTTRYKPAATVLAVIADEEQEGAYGPLVVVAVQPFGRGRSMAFTTDSTGGWGLEWEDSWGEDENDPALRNSYYKTFWKNAVRWLAHYRMQAPNQLVQLETDRLVYGRGETPEVRVKVLTEDYEPTHDAQVKLAVTGPDGKRNEVSVFPRYDEPGIYERKLELPAVGRYELEARAALKGDELGRDKALVQVRPATEELRRLSQDVETLEKIAKESGGEYLALDKAGTVPDLLRKDTHVVQRYRDVDLWDRWPVFALIIAVLCVEWFYRKKHGLP